MSGLNFFSESNKAKILCNIKSVTYEIKYVITTDQKIRKHPFNKNYITFERVRKEVNNNSEQRERMKNIFCLTLMRKINPLFIHKE